MVSKLNAIILAIAFGVFIVPVAAVDDARSPVPEIGATVVRQDRYPAQDVSFPNHVKGVPGIVYWTQLGYRPLRLDLYLPPDSMARPASGFPTVIFLHSGGWRGGDLRRNGVYVDFPGLLASLSARGYVVASIEFRLSGEAVFPAQIQDVKAAIRWLRLHAPEYGIDPARAMTWGTSSGGHLAALAAVTCHEPAFDPVPGSGSSPAAKSEAIALSGISDCVQGSVSWFGVYDMATIAAQSRQDKAMSRDVPEAPEWRLLGCFAAQCKPAQIAAASPVTYIQANEPPMLLVVGSEDTTVPYHQTLEMADRLKSAGAPYEILVLQGVDHDFIGKTLEQTRDPNLKALAATFRFFDETIGKGSHTGLRP